MLQYADAGKEVFITSTGRVLLNPKVLHTFLSLNRSTACTCFGSRSMTYRKASRSAVWFTVSLDELNEQDAPS
jgi:hypothetical protein